MPIYEYRCQNCRRRVSLLVRGWEPPPEPRCTFCGGTGLTRLISTFAVLRSEDQLLERMADPSQMGDVDEKDPRSMARWMRRMGREMGEDLGPEFDEMVDH